jgi:broad specificity phosphatase PhoE
MDKTLVFIRHAHRDTAVRTNDNGLDQKGRDQAKSLRRFFFERFSEKDIKAGLWLVSSPKLRCQETLQPIAKELQRAIDIHPSLDEQNGKESAAQFSGRVSGFLKEWRENASPLTLVCSHGDWLPVASQLLTQGVYVCKKGSWHELVLSESGLELVWSVPSFKPFFG